MCADHACLACINQGIDIDYAIGDFDSVTSDEFAMIQKKAQHTLAYEVRKDYTDTYLAVKEALKHSPNEIVIYGGLGNRIDHTLANIDLLQLGRISIHTNDSLMYVLNPGEYDIENGFTYISFFALEDVKNLTLDGFSYPLKEYDLNRFDPLCVSNKGEGNVSFTEGTLLVVHQNEKST
jgi:thiamine pyrophosphokinase